jgi:hypothetical protein
MNAPTYSAPLQIGNAKWQTQEYKSLVIVYSGEGNPPKSPLVHSISLDKDSPTLVYYESPKPWNEEEAQKLLELLKETDDVPFEVLPGSWMEIMHQMSEEH